MQRRFDLRKSRCVVKIKDINYNRVLGSSPSGITEKPREAKITLKVYCNIKKQIVIK